MAAVSGWTQSGYGERWSAAVSRRLIITRFKTGGAMGRQGHAEPRANLNESAIGLTTDLVYPNRSDPARDTLADWLRSQVAAQPSAQFGHIDEVSVGHGDNAPRCSQA